MQQTPKLLRLIKNISKKEKSSVDLYQDINVGRIFVAKKVDLKDKIDFDAKSGQKNTKISASDFEFIKTKRHQNVLTAIIDHEISINDNKLTLTFPYYAKGSLSNILNSNLRGIVNSEFDATKKSIIAYGIAQAMLFLHNNQIIHCLLNPSHVLLNSQYHPVVSGYWYSACNNMENCINDEKDMSSFLAPELISNSNTNPYDYFSRFNSNSTNNSAPPNNSPQPLQIDQANDVFSFGMILLSLLLDQINFSKSPYLTLSKIIPLSTPTVLRNIISKCLETDKGCRLTFDEIIYLMDDSPTLFEGTDETQYAQFKEYSCRKVNWPEIPPPQPIGDVIEPKDQFEMYKKASEKSNPFAQLLCAIHRNNGIGCSVNKKASQKAYKSAADFGLTEGQFNYGLMLGKNPKNAQVRAESLRYIINSANAGNTDAQIHLAKMIMKNQVPGSNPGAVTHYLSLAAANGNAEAAKQLADLFKSGKKFHRDLEKATQYMKCAADLGEAESQLDYATVLLNKAPKNNQYKKGNNNDHIDIQFGDNPVGQIDPQITLATSYLRSAVNNGSSKACKLLSSLFVEGQASPRSPDEAYTVFKIAATEQGDERARDALANLIFDQRILPSDETELCNAIKNAADAGNIGAILEYAHLLKTGRGKVPRDLSLSAKYFQIAAEKPYFSPEGQYQHGKCLIQNRLTFKSGMESIYKAVQAGHVKAEYTYCKNIISDENEFTVNTSDLEGYLKHAIAAGYEKAKGVLGILYIYNNHSNAIERTGFEYLKSSAFSTKSPYLLRNYADKIEQENPEEAFTCYKMLTECTTKVMHLSYAYFKIGLAYKNGQGVPIDKQKAVEYFAKDLEICETIQETPDMLVEMYKEDGKLGNLSDKETYEVMKKAADLECPDAMEIVSQMFRNGLGVPKNEAEANRYMARAYELKEEDNEYDDEDDDGITYDPPPMMRGHYTSGIPGMGMGMNMSSSNMGHAEEFEFKLPNGMEDFIVD
ncbi:hypothetical protein TRFO_39389 [Tritrichomonas foetus]|uniref:Protein kinase domain-containing protein n=1 Tax=Tritrichomonas foetus TaxID=1144522 RepID=A0A1J4JAE5_9EUKA|nr:hypothetical protein TRFO_39389 [Tritrichomonas foetus]|eukprot:OHS94421.1 hypothetical protein TRFO_39389 [Tritrichomonas foetus]